jgi:regulator of PEP synthase PpsR (kinase-PPPase family)
MSKAEEAALKAYPDMEMNDIAMLFQEQRRLFQEGYEQAEKDLALTWEDAQLLYIITEKYMRELDKRIEAFPSSSQDVFEEILRRYKEAKK